MQPKLKMFAVIKQTAKTEIVQSLNITAKAENLCYH